MTAGPGLRIAAPPRRRPRIAGGRTRWTRCRALRPRRRRHRLRRVLVHRVEGQQCAAAGRSGEAEGGQQEAAAARVRGHHALGHQSLHPRGQPVAEVGEVPAEHHRARVQDVRQQGKPEAEPVRDPVQGLQRAGVPCGRPRLEVREPCLQVEGGVVYGIPGAGGVPQQGGEPDHGLPAAAAPAGTERAARVERHVADLPGEPGSSAVEPAAADDAAAHARLAGDVDQVVDTGRGSLQVLGHRAEFGVVLKATQRRRPAPQAGTDPADRFHVVPADVRGVDDGDPGRGDRGGVEGGKGLADQPGGAVQDGLGSGAADAHGDPPLEGGVPAQGEGDDGQVGLRGGLRERRLRLVPRRRRLGGRQYGRPAHAPRSAQRPVHAGPSTTSPSTTSGPRPRPTWP